MYTTRGSKVRARPRAGRCSSCRDPCSDRHLPRAQPATGALLSGVSEEKWRNPHGSPPLFVVPPVPQGNGLIPRSRRFVFARQREIRFGAHLVAKTGVLRKQNHVFLRSPRGDWAPLFEAIFRVYYYFGRKNRRFFMARVRTTFRGTARNSGDFGSVVFGPWRLLWERSELGL